MRKGKSRSPPKLSNGRLPLILACLPTTCKNTDSQGCAIFMLISVSLIYALVLFLSNYLLYRYEKRE